MRTTAGITRRQALAAGGAALALRPAAAAGRTVVDLAGRSVLLPERLQRLASAGGSPAVNAFLFLFGLGGRIVTGLPAAFDGPAWRFQRLFGPGISRAPVVSGPPPAWSPNIEALLALQPDLCFVVSEQAAQVVERARLPALVLQWDRADSIASTVRLLGEVFADPARVAAYVAWEAGLTALITRRLGQPGVPPPRPRVLYLRHATLTQPIMVPANQMIERAGGDSVTARDNPLGLDVLPFSVEQLLAWQPEVLLLAPGDEVARVLADPRLASVPAVRQRRVWRVPHGAHLWTHYTPEQPLGVLWLAQKLHPERMSEGEVSAQTKDFYQRFFGHALGEADLGSLLLG